MAELKGKLDDGGLEAAARVGTVERGIEGLAVALVALVLLSWIVGGSLRTLLTRVAARTTSDWDDLLVEPLKISDGHVTVPTRPGLGVAVDEERLAYYAKKS